MRTNGFLVDRSFWVAFVITGVVMTLIFAWELGSIPGVSSPPRGPASTFELAFAVLLTLLLSFDAGLLHWRTKKGTCPIGAKRATQIGGVVGTLTLLCPVCILLPFGIFGLSLSLAVLGPFLPLLRIIALLLAGMSAVLLWPKS